MSSTTPTRDARDSREPIRILFVGADETSFEAARSTFEDEFGIDARLATRRKDVYQALESVDCIVSDVRAPPTTELTLLRTVRESHPDLPYIVFTDVREDEFVSAALSAGVTDILWKDTADSDYRWLASRVASVVGERNTGDAGRSSVLRRGVAEGGCLVDESLAFVAVTESFAELHGYAPAELVGEPLATVFPDDESRRLEHVLNRVESEGRVTDESIARTTDGTTFPVRVTIGRAAGGYVCTVVDLTDRVDVDVGLTDSVIVELERRLRSLEPLFEASSAAEPVRERVVWEGIVEPFDDDRESVGAALYLYDERADTLRRRAVTPRFEDTARELPFDGESTPAWRAFVDHEPVFVDEVIPQPTGIVSDPIGARGVVIPVQAHGVLVVGVSDEGRLAPFDHTFARLVGAVAETVLSRLDRERRLEASESILDTQQATIDRLTATNALFRRVARVIAAARTREELEERVCTQIVSHDRYTFARIGGYDDVRGHVQDRAWAGSEKRYVESLGTDVGALVEDGEPMAVAIRTRDTRVEGHLLASPGEERWRRDAVTRGFRSVLAVPIVFRNRRFGALAVYSQQPATFDDHERELFEELGTWLGHAIHAIETRVALVGRGGVELEFRVRDRRIQFVEWARETGCTLEFETILSRPDGTIRGFFTVEGAPVETILDLASRSPAVADTRLVTERGESHLFECTLTEDSVVAHVLEYGAVPKTIAASEAAGRVVVTIPTHADVREFVDVFTELYPESTLVRRQDHEYVVRTDYGFLAELESQLTERQLEALETAFVSGYFEVPRETTGEEVAEMLGIAQPTFNHHLRAAQRKLFSMMFTDGVVRGR